MRSAARWMVATVVIATATYWAYNPQESSARIQLKEISQQEQLLSNQLYEEGALDARLVLSPALTPAWDVQVVDASNPKMPQLSAFMKQKRELSQQIANEQGSIQTPFRNVLGFVGPIFAIALAGRTIHEFVGYRRDFGNSDIPQSSQAMSI